MAYDYVPLCSGQVIPQAFINCFPTGMQGMISFVEFIWEFAGGYAEQEFFHSTYFAFNPTHTEKMFKAFVDGWGFFLLFNPEVELWFYYNTKLWPTARSALNPCSSIIKAPPSCPQRAPSGMYP